MQDSLIDSEDHTEIEQNTEQIDLTPEPQQQKLSMVKKVEQEYQCTDTELNEWVPLVRYTSEFLDTDLDIPDEAVNQQFFKMYTSQVDLQTQMYDVMLANKVLDSGVPNRFGCCIPVKSNWNHELLSQLLLNYEDQELLEWLKYGFPLPWEGVVPPTPSTVNHKGATMYPECIDNYIEKELHMGACMGPFSIPPFACRLGVLPMSTRAKKDLQERCIILDLSFPKGRSVNDGIPKNHYCRQEIKLTYPTIDTLAQRIMQLGVVA